MQNRCMFRGEMCFRVYGYGIEDDLLYTAYSMLHSCSHADRRERERPQEPCGGFQSVFGPSRDRISPPNSLPPQILSRRLMTRISHTVLLAQ